MVVGDFAIELRYSRNRCRPGGYVAAIRAAQEESKVAIIEKRIFWWCLLKRWMYSI